MSRKQKIFQATGMAFVMSLCMSFVMSAINVGFQSTFLFVWMSSAAVGFMVALPLSFVVPPMILKLMHALSIK